MKIWNVLAADAGGLPVIVWIVLPIIMISQGTWLFIDARKREASCWFWGIWGLIQFPTPLVFYWLFVRKQVVKKLRARTRKEQ